MMPSQQQSQFTDHAVSRISMMERLKAEPNPAPRPRESTAGAAMRFLAAVLELLAREPCVLARISNHCDEGAANLKYEEDQRDRHASYKAIRGARLCC